MLIIDTAVRNAQLVESGGPLLKFGACRAAESDVIEADAGLVEGRSAGGLMSVDAEELAFGQRPDGVVVGALALDLVEDWIGADQGGVPLRAAGEVADGDGGVRDRWKSGMTSLPG